MKLRRGAARHTKPTKSCIDQLLVEVQRFALEVVRLSFIVSLREPNYR